MSNIVKKLLAHVNNFWLFLYIAPFCFPAGFQKARRNFLSAVFCVTIWKMFFRGKKKRPAFLRVLKVVAGAGLEPVTN